MGDEHDYVPRKAPLLKAEPEPVQEARSRPSSGKCKLEDLICHACGQGFKSRNHYAPLWTQSERRDYHVACRPSPTDWRDSHIDAWLRQRPKVRDGFRGRNREQLQRYVQLMVSALRGNGAKQTNKRPSEGGPGAEAMS